MLLPTGAAMGLPGQHAVGAHIPASSAAGFGANPSADLIQQAYAGVPQFQSE